MRIAYINPAYGQDFVRSARWAAKSRGRVQRHPEQALIQIAVLEKAGHTCTFIEGAARNMTEQQVQEEIRKFSPDLAIIHTTTPSIYNDINYARRAKEISGCKTVLVGAHASAVPEDTLEKGGKAIDIIARGEADYTLRDIANGLPSKDILGISYLKMERLFTIIIGAYLDVNELPSQRGNILILIGTTMLENYTHFSRFTLVEAVSAFALSAARRKSSTGASFVCAILKR